MSEQHATKEDFLFGFQRRYKEVPGVPFATGPRTVLIGNQSENERQKYEAWIRDREGKIREDRRRTCRYKFVVDCVYSGTLASPGPRMFSDADLPALMKADLDYGITDKLFDEIIAWLGLNGADLEEISKNLPSVPVGASQ